MFFANFSDSRASTNSDRSTGRLPSPIAASAIISRVPIFLMNW
jgi:hypothetical protein